MRNVLARYRPRGMFGFLLVWFGQLTSATATGMTVLVLNVWLLQKTLSPVALGWLEFCFQFPAIIFLLFSGVMVDRYNRRLMMLVYDLATIFSVLFLLVFNFFGVLQPWHLYLAMFVQGMGYAFQSPSYYAAITTMVPKSQFVRANGLMSLLEDLPEVIAPIILAVPLLLGFLGLTGALAINTLALLFSIAMLFLVVIPRMPHTLEGVRSHGNLWKEINFGFDHIFKRPSLLGLQTITFFGNLFSGIAISNAVFFAMITFRTGDGTVGDTSPLGRILFFGSLAGAFGGLFLSIWGGLKKQIHGVLMAWIVSGLFGYVLLGVGRVEIIWLIAYVIESLCDPLFKVANQTIWQKKVAPDLQGRVFGARYFIGLSITPFAPLIGASLGERLFEPAMRGTGPLPSLFGWIVGTEPGSGYALLIVFCGIGAALTGLLGYFISSIRKVEEVLPDYDAVPTIEEIEEKEAASPLLAD